MENEFSYPPVFYQIAELIKSAGGFLVGGAIRDQILGIDIHDLDFALPADTIPAARMVADSLGGDIFILDPDRETARVILKDQEGGRLMVDFTLFQGKTIEEDLQARDFTITSMAVDLAGNLALIDPFNGVQDLREGVIRATTPTSVLDDPLRGLRAVRLAAQLSFKILPETREQVRECVHLMDEISRERLRDELFRILAGPRQGVALLTAQQLGIYTKILPGAFTAELSNSIRAMELIWSIFIQDHNQEIGASWALGTLIHRLGRYREPLRSHLREEIVPDRSIYQLSFLGRLVYSKNTGSNSDKMSDQFSLSNQELNRLNRMTQAARSFDDLVDGAESIRPIEVYRYFRDYGSAGVEGMVISLADYLGANPADQDGQWLYLVDQARQMLEGWWEKRDEWVDPPSLLNGDVLQKELDLEPGPRIGLLLEAVREAQVNEEVISREDALNYLRQSHITDGFSEHD